MMLSKNKIVYLLLPLLVQCASQSFEEDSKDPHYYDTKPSLTRDERTQSEPGRAGPDIRGGLGLTTNEAAITGVLATGILLAGNRDYYRKSAITGKCICGTTKDSNIQLPCTQVNIAITDAKGKVLSRMEPNDGEFAFRVQKKLPYRLKVESKKYQLADKLDRDFYLGDDVIINLVQK